MKRGSDQAHPAIAGEQVRFATILFADIVGSTRLLGALDPEDVRDVLDRALRIVKDAIHAMGGLVLRVQGDGVMAVFGFRPAVEDHALRAALAGRQIVEEMRHGLLGIVPSPSVRVGIHSGLVLLRWQENDFGTMLDVVGHAANVAGQVERRAGENGVAISATTLDLIGEACEVHPIEAISISETAAPLTVFDLRQIDMARGDQVNVKGSARHPLIGRETAMAALNDLVGNVARGNGQALAIVGDAGMGKSRLLAETAEVAEAQGARFVTVRGSELTGDVPFGCLAPTMRHLIELLGRDNSDIALEARLTHDEAECLAGLAAGNQTWLSSASPGERRRIAIATARTVLRMVAREMPLVVLADDFQYIDGETQDLLRSLAAAVRLSGLGLVLASRPAPDLFLDDVVEQTIGLGNLSPDQALVLITRIAGERALLPELVEEIANRSAGLPLAVTEFTTAAMLRSVDARQRGDEPLPSRLESLFTLRLDGLEGEAARLAYLCAALGPTISNERLHRIGSALLNNVDEAIARLVEHRILVFDHLSQARFTHQLLQEAAYRTLSRVERRALHASIYAELASDSAVYGPSDATQAELAAHAERADLLSEALRHLWKACGQAVALAAIESIPRLYERACTLADRLGGTEGIRQRARFALLAFDALQQLSQEQVTRPDMEAVARGDFDMGSDQRTIARINMALLDWINGAPRLARGWLDQAEADLAQDFSMPRRVYADITGTYIAYSLAEPDDALDRVRRLTEGLRGGHAAETFGAVVVIPHILALSFGGWYAADLGQTELAQAWIDEALAISYAHQHNYSRLLADLANGFQHYRSGRIDIALDILTKAHDHCLRHRFLGFEPAAVSWLALCLIETGDIGEAQRVLDASIARGNFLRIRTSATYYHYEARTRLALTLGHHEVALDLSAQALAHCRDCGEAMHLHHARVLREEVLLATGTAQPHEREREQAELMQALTELGLVPLQRKLAALQLVPGA
ncbi:adenylate/guanylate cyclase domain-containing protein [Novosphingobium sp. FKTRR1]|uniref:ATP-binding protein n=1 Tax=Novosphingobium sp. FKTRR1 TaxID=2879118 RepID=UPI001CF09C3E